MNSISWNSWNSKSWGELQVLIDRVTWWCLESLWLSSLQAKQMPASRLKAKVFLSLSCNIEFLGLSRHPTWHLAHDQILHKQSSFFFLKKNYHCYQILKLQQRGLRVAWFESAISISISNVQFNWFLFVIAVTILCAGTVSNWWLSCSCSDCTLAIDSCEREGDEIEDLVGMGRQKTISML